MHEHGKRSAIALAMAIGVALAGSAAAQPFSFMEFFGAEQSPPEFPLEFYYPRSAPSVGSGGFVGASSGIQSSSDSGLWMGVDGVATAVLLSGDAAPDMPSGTVIGDLASGVGSAKLVLNDSATGLALIPTVLGTTTRNVVYRMNLLGTPYKVVAEGDVDPTTGGRFVAISSLVATNVEEGGFFATLEHGGGIGASNDSGYWHIGAAGGVTLIAREGSAAPGTSGVFASFVPVDIYQASYLPPMSDAGGRLIHGTLAHSGSIGEDNDEGLWIVRTDGGRLLAREDSIAPGTSGAAFDHFYFNTGINADERAVFRATLKHGVATNVDATNDEAIFVGADAESLYAPVRKGHDETLVNAGIADFMGASNYEILSGFRDEFGEWQQGYFLVPFDTLAINDQGYVLYQARLAGTEVNDANDDVLFVHDGANSLVVWREGDMVPGYTGPDPEELRFTHLAGPASINRRGNILFRAGMASEEFHCSITFGTAERAIRMFLTTADQNLHMFDCNEVDSRNQYDHPCTGVFQAAAVSSGGSDGRARGLGNDQYFAFRLNGGRGAIGDGVDSAHYLARDRTGCRGDIDVNPGFDLGDLFAFFSLFDSGRLVADINADDIVDLSDFFEFLDLMDLGC